MKKIKLKLKMLDRELGINFGIKGGIATKAISDLNYVIAKALSNEETNRELRKTVLNQGYPDKEGFDEEKISILREKSSKLLENKELNREKIDDEKILNTARTRSGSTYKELERIIREEHSDLIKTFYGSEFAIQNFSVLEYHNPESVHNIREKLESVLDWHLDYHSSANSIRMLIFLTDQRDSGSLDVVSRNDSLELLERIGLDKIKDKDEISEYEVKKYYGSKGEFILFNHLECLHRGDLPEEGGTRRALIVTFSPSLSNSPS